MNIDIQRDGKISREAVWLTAWCMVATASNRTTKSAPAAWADECLSAFDERFPRPTPEAKEAE